MVGATSIRNALTQMARASVVHALPDSMVTAMLDAQQNAEMVYANLPLEKIV